MGRGSESLAEQERSSAPRTAGAAAPPHKSSSIQIKTASIRSCGNEAVCISENLSRYFTTLTKMMRNVNRTSDSMKASPTNRAI